MKTIQRGSANPMIVMEPDDILEWLRERADEAGYADRESSAVQFQFTDPQTGEEILRNDLPEIVFMVSNIANSREPTEKPAAGTATDLSMDTSK